MNNELLSSCESAVANIEHKLAELAELDRAKTVLQGNLSHIASQRAELIAGDADEKKKIAGVKDLDIQREVKQMDLAKLDGQIGCCKQGIIAAAIDANGRVQKLKDAMIAAEKERAKQVLLEVFPAKVAALMEAFMGHATAVKALEIDYLVFMPEKVDFCLAQARKIQPQLETLKGTAPAAKPVEAASNADRLLGPGLAG